MDTSRINEGKAPQHLKTQKTHHHLVHLFPLDDELRREDLELLRGYEQSAMATSRVQVQLQLQHRVADLLHALH